MTHLYVHIPFCATICSYCDFAKVLSDVFDIDLYLEHLTKELLSKAVDTGYDTIYIGGGTPTVLSDSQLSYLFELLRPYSKNTVEYTIEMNVETMTERKLDIVTKSGVNRISIGVQTFNIDLLQAIERQHTEDMIRLWLNRIQHAGIQNVSVDMMYALPHQTIDDVNYDLSLINEFIYSGMIHHISYYALQLEANTKFGLAKICELQDDLQLEYYQTIERALAQVGFNKYEISNFAKQGYESKHNSAYWQSHEYTAVGLGAHGYENQIRYENTKSMTSYLKGSYMLSQKKQTKKAMMEDYMIFGLRMVRGVSKQAFFDRFSEHIEMVFSDMNALIETGQIIEKEDRVFIAPDNFFSMHYILEKFIL